MHLYILVRGIKYCVDNYINDLSAQYFKYAKNHNVSLAVRPIQLYELVFPKEHESEVISTVFEAKPADDWRSKYLGVIRTTLGARKVDANLYDANKARLIWRHNVAVYPVGVLDDGTNKDGKFKGYERL